jgi:hypothetical protein
MGLWCYEGVHGLERTEVESWYRPPFGIFDNFKFGHFERFKRPGWPGCDCAVVSHS